MQHAIIGRKVIFDRLAHAKGRDQVCQHLCSIDSAPHHRIVRHFIELVPCQFGCHKIIDSAFFHDLRQCPGISEHIRQPEDTVVHAKFLFEKAFAMHKLTDEGFSRCQIAVCLNPHTAFRLPAFLFDALFCFLVQFRIALL